MIEAGRVAPRAGSCHAGALPPPPPRRGLSVPLWGDAADAEVRLAEVAALGATDVALVVTWGQPDVRAAAIAPSPATAPDEAVRRAIRAARGHGLRVLVFPILTVDRVAPGEWRGTLAPADVDAWWQAYERFVLHYAALAAGDGAEALSIGSELGSTEAWRDRWYHLISRVEKVFAGELTYSANWDHFTGVSFAARLDLLGVTGYFELTRDADASEDALTRAWQAPRDALLAWAQRQGKPLALTEIGYPSLDGAAARPWDYMRRAAVDVEEQRRAYRAFARAWGGTPLAAIYVWEWSRPGGADDGGYTPRDKPAACELSTWFGAS